MPNLIVRGVAKNYAHSHTFLEERLLFDLNNGEFVERPMVDVGLKDKIASVLSNGIEQLSAFSGLNFSGWFFQT